MTEKLKHLQTSKNEEYSSPPNQLYNQCERKICKQETQEKKRPTIINPKQLKITVIGTYISITTLNVNGLNAPTRRHRPAEWIKKHDKYIRCLPDTHSRPRDTYRLKVRGWKKIFHANGNQKKAIVAILISDKIDFKTKTITRDKDTT